MTTYDRRTITCALCGRDSIHAVITSTNRFGSPDLDLRPPEMERSTLAQQVQLCPFCGHCGFDLETAPPSATAIVTTADYQQQLKDPDLPPKANALLCVSLIKEASGDLRGAAQASLQAAWLGDDASNAEGSRRSRARAAALLQRHHQGEPSLTSEAAIDLVILVDVLRRAGQFAAAQKACEECLRQSPPPNIQRVLAFQRKRIEEQDVTGYKVDDATA